MPMDIEIGDITQEKTKFISLLKEKYGIITLNSSIDKKRLEKVFTFAVQIVNSEKNDMKYYMTKVEKESGGSKESSNTKMSNRMFHLKDFMDKFSKIVEEESNLLSEAKLKELEALEYEEIKSSLNDVGDLFKKLKPLNRGGLQKEWKNNLDLLKEKDKDGEKVSIKIIPTLGGLLSKLYKDNKTGYELKTPFGVVEVKLNTMKEYGTECLIYSKDESDSVADEEAKTSLPSNPGNKKGTADTYDNICTCLDNLFTHYGKDDIIKNIIDPMLEYLKHKSIKAKDIKDIIDKANKRETNNKKKGKKNKSKTNPSKMGTLNEEIANNEVEEKEVKGSQEDNVTPQNLLSLIQGGDKVNLDFLDRDEKTEDGKQPPSKEEVEKKASSLCGILILAETCQYRNPTFGKLERNAMKTVRRLAENGCMTPFKKVFSNEKAWYIPARNNGGNMDTQALLSFDFSNDSIKNRFLPLPNLLDNNSYSQQIKNIASKIGKKCEDKAKEKIHDYIKEIALMESDKVKKSFYKKKVGINKAKDGKINGYQIAKSIVGKMADDEIAEKFVEKANKFFPHKFIEVAAFRALNDNKEKQKELKNILDYKPEEDNNKAIEQVKNFLDLVKKDLYKDMVSPAKLDEYIRNQKFNRFNDLSDFIQKLTDCTEKGKFSPIKLLELCKSPDNYTKLNELPKLESKYFNEFLSKKYEGNESDLQTYMQNKIESNFKNLYKSQYQTPTKKEAKELLDIEKAQTK